MWLFKVISHSTDEHTRNYFNRIAIFEQKLFIVHWIHILASSQLLPNFRKVIVNLFGHVCNNPCRHANFWLKQTFPSPCKNQWNTFQHLTWFINHVFSYLGSSIICSTHSKYSKFVLLNGKAVVRYKATYSFWLLVIEMRWSPKQR